MIAKTPSIEDEDEQSAFGSEQFGSAEAFGIFSKVVNYDPYESDIENFTRQPRS
jgi:hypothetical protein